MMKKCKIQQLILLEDVETELLQRAGVCSSVAASWQAWLVVFTLSCLAVR